MDTRPTVLEIQGARTLRWHTTPHGNYQTVAEHSAMVALLARHISPAGLTNRERLEILELSLDHDLHEGKYGDLPYPAKVAMKAMGIDVDRTCALLFWGDRLPPEDRVSPLARDIVETADRLEAALYAAKWIPSEAAGCAEAAIAASQRLDYQSQAKVLQVLGRVPCIQVQEPA